MNFNNKMESTIAVILLFLCIARSSAKIDILGNTEHIQIESESNDLHLDANQLSNEIGNCREACLQKFSLDEATCSQAPVCIECWETCNTISSHQQAIDQNQWQLRIASMIKQEFLVATHLAWEPTNKLINCLVTWEVFGGGLMGNLLTDSANVELSLWPDTKYRVQVTCKNEVTGLTVKSYPLTVDTTQAIKMKPESSSSSEIVTESEIDTETETSENDDSQSNDSYDFAENYRRRLISVNDTEYRYKSLMLGMCAALIVFLFVLTVLCASASQRNLSNSKIDSHPSNAQQKNVLLTEIITVRS